MSEASQHTAAWRKAKLREEYGRLDVWVPLDTLAQFKQLATRRRQSLSACLTDAAVALAGLRGQGRSVMMNVQEREKMMREVKEELRAELRGEFRAVPSGLADTADTGDADTVILNEDGIPLPVGYLMASSVEPPAGKKRCAKTLHFQPLSDSRCRACKQTTDAKAKRRQRARQQNLQAS